MSQGDVADRARAWIAGDPDPETRAELEALVLAQDWPALEERMAPELDFGTAGLRGPVGAGPARVNRAVIVRATRAFAEHLLVHVPDARSQPVLVGYDARPSSRELAEVAIGVLLAAGVPVRFFEEPAPTPLVAYAARVLQGSGALVVTASHNPREDNGLKVYGPSAVQLVAPADADVARRREGLGPAASQPRVDFPRVVEGVLGARAERVSPALFDRYLSELEAQLPSPIGRRDLKIAYTPLHGLGFAPVTRALRARGFTAIHAVPDQSEPDGNFPTAPSPNPELPGTLDAVLALAARTGAELVLANDPDVDRLAAAAPLASGGYHVFTGNEVAVLLADFVLEQWPVGSVPLLVTSAVSTPLLGRIGAHYGAHVERTLTGFKWIMSAARALEASNRGRFALGCEEALGYSVGPLVRDKDGISAAVWLAELAARELHEGKSLVDRLHALYARHGVWASAQRSLFRSGAHARASFRERIDALVENPPGALGGESFRGGTDYRTGAENRPPWLGVSDLFELRYGSSTRVLVRPSGTEPKLKLYVDHEENPKQYATTEEAVRCARDRAEAIAETVLTLLSD